ncbi:DnaJ family domain-containing protein [Virgibacillus natechei]|uniref:DnaJ family domain-containing protein n=1 Tax=Virgibacillus sp. CBA3643 TaxID=2942278 RepID=UPI0035A39DBF
MYIFVEEQIKKAVDNGEFEDLPGKGKPLNLHDDLQGVPPELRMGYKILKNAGYLTEETDKNKKDVSMDDLLTSATGNKEKNEVQNKLEFEAFAREKKLHKNKKFSTYAQKIYKKLF